MESELKWYQSTQGPEISNTIKAVIGLLVPTLKTITGFEFDNALIDHTIDGVLIAGFALYAMYGYIKAKRTLGARIKNLSSQIETLGGKPM